MQHTTMSEDVDSLIKAIRQLDHTLRLHLESGRYTKKTKEPTTKYQESSQATGAYCRAGKTTVYVRVEFLKIGEIDTLKEHYSADVFVQARWREPALDGKQHMDADEIDWAAQWNPSLYIENALGECKEVVWHTLCFDDQGRATVFEKRRVKATFMETLELYDFPFDTQDLTVTVTSERSENEVNLEEDTENVSSINVMSFVDEQEWRLHTHVDIKRRSTTKAYQNPRAKHCALSCACQATRRPGFFIWNIILVMIFICSLGFATFAVKITLPQNRLQLSFILVLTCITFKFVVNQNLPRISYLTYLDKYILTSMAILCIVCVWHAIIAQVEEIDLKLAITMDRYALGLISGFYIFFQLFFFIWVFVVSKRNLHRVFKKAELHKGRMDKTPKDEASGGGRNKNNGVAPANVP